MPSQITYKPNTFSSPNSPKNTTVFHPDSSGKEKDAETGYHYFGARYYNSDLSLWLSVDPMADKYPSLSPYNYCAWNPMKLVDPDGDSIIIKGNTDILYTEGMEYHGNDPFVSQSVNALNEIYNNGGDEGKDLITSLTSSNYNYKIEKRLNGRSEYVADSRHNAAMSIVLEANGISLDAILGSKIQIGSGGVVFWNTDGYPIMTTEGVKNNTTFQLLHELCHASDSRIGQLGDYAEENACYQSNVIARNMGLPLHSVYGGTLNQDGTVSGGIKLIDNQGNPIRPQHR